MLPNPETPLTQSPSHPEHQPKRRLHEGENDKARIPKAGNTTFNLGDGNADKEAEKLKPSPNFYVHSVLFEGTLMLV